MQQVSHTFSHRSLAARKVVLAAHELDQLGVGHEALVHAERERPGEGLGVLDRHLNLQRAEGGAADSLGQLQPVAARRAPLVDPRLILEAARLHHQRVALPPARRIAVPPRLRIVGRQRPAVEMDLALAVVGLVEDQDEVRRLDDLPRLRVEMELDRVEGQTVRVGVILAVGAVPLGLQLHRPREHRRLGRERVLQIAERQGRRDAGKGPGRRHLARQQPLVPHPRQVRLSVGGARCGRRHVHAAIRGARRRGLLERRPLRQQGRRQQQRHEPDARDELHAA